MIFEFDLEWFLVFILVSMLLIILKLLRFLRFLNMNQKIKDCCRLNKKDLQNSDRILSNGKFDIISIKNHVYK